MTIPMDTEVQDADGVYICKLARDVEDGEEVTLADFKEWAVPEAMSVIKFIRLVLEPAS